MSFKKFIFILLIAYAIYFALISMGYVKKDFVVEDESATFLQKIIALITPLSPQEKDEGIREKVAALNLELSVEKGNLKRYEEWRADAEANPPAWEYARQKLRAELEKDRRPKMKEKIEYLKKEIVKLNDN